MPRPNPLNTELPKDWPETTLKILEIAVCPPGSAALPIVTEILSHERTGEAIKFLLAASGGPTLTYNIAIAQAFGGCVIARTAEQLRRKNASKSEATHREIKRVWDSAMAIAEIFPTHKFSIYDRASVLFDKASFTKLDNITILNALLIAGGLMDAITHLPKRHNTGRPIDWTRKTLVINLANLFREHFGKPVSGAVGALVSATFPRQPELTGQDVQRMLSRL